MPNETTARTDRPASLEVTRFRLALAEAGVPQHLHDGLIRYRFDKVRPGGFLRAVLANNMFAAMQYWDGHGDLRALCAFIGRELPTESWGSEKAVGDWLTSGREP